MPVAHTYKLGKDQLFSFDTRITNANVKDVTITRETAAEAELTTRGSESIQEFVPVRWNSTIEVVCFDHTAPIHSTGVVTIGMTGSLVTGLYYVNNVGEPQVVDGAIEYSITLKRFIGVQAS